MRARLLLASAALLAFGVSLGSGFHFDDYAIFSGALLKWAGPLTRLTFRATYLAAGESPLLYHLVSLLLHLAAVMLVFECLKRIAGGDAALIAAGLFAVHPLQAEAVNYVAARGLLLDTVLALAALLLWLLKQRIAAAVLALGASVDAVLSAIGAAHAPAVHAGNFILAQGVVMWRYLKLFVLPWGFTIDPDVRVPPLWLGLLGWIAIAALALAAWHWKQRWIAAALAIMIIGSLFPARDFAADYRMYPAMFALCAGVGLLFDRAKLRDLAILLVALLMFAGAWRSVMWLSDERLWREAVRAAPDKARPKLQLARSVRASEALELLARARDLDPHDPEIPGETGKIFLEEGQFNAAVDQFNAALALDPLNALNLNNRGVANFDLGNTDGARADFEKALSIDPNFSEARQNLEKLGGR